MKAIQQRRLFQPLFLCLWAASSVAAAQDPLPSWNGSSAKHSILQFVADVTHQNAANFVPPEQRIATFDNDGTLWVEQPIYTQFAFVLGRVKALAPNHPEWKQQQPFKAVLDGDMKALAASGEPRLVQLTAATHAAMTTDEFEGVVKDWMRTAQHPRFDRTYTRCIYQPMLELLAYL